MLESLVIFIIIITVIGFATTLTSPQFHTSQIIYTPFPLTDQSPSHTLAVLHLVFVQCFPGLQLPFLFLFTACLSQVQPHPPQACPGPLLPLKVPAQKLGFRRPGAEPPCL